MGIGPDGWLYAGDRDRLWRIERRSLKAESMSIPLFPEGDGLRRGPVIQGDKLWVSDARGRLLRGTWSKGRWTWTWDDLPGSEGNPVVDLISDDIGRAWAIRSDHVFCHFEERWEKLPRLSGSGGGGPMGLSFRSKEEGFAAQYDPPAVLAVRRAASGWTARTLIGPEQFRDIGVLYSIRQDTKGTLWLGTDRGVVRVELGDAPRFRRFGKDMGLPSEDTNQGALLVEGTDRVWVGTALGLAEIRAGELGSFPPMAAPSILAVRCGSRAIQGPDSVLRMNYGQGAVAWELGFPGPVRSDRARFEFRAAGGTWTALSGTALQFPFISPGYHLYEVRVVPSLGPAGSSRRLEMYVHPPWYRHTFAYVIFGFMAVGLLIGVFRARVVLLERRNRELNRAVKEATKELKQHRENLEKLVGRRTADLNERIKELRCGYGVSKLIAEPGTTVEQVLEKALPLLLSGLNRPDIACARIAFEGREFATANFRGTPWKLSADIAASGKRAGSLEVFYLEERPAPPAGPFLKEEHELINDLGLQLGLMVENKRAEKDLREKDKLITNVVNSTPDLIFVKDTGLRTILCNEAYAAAVGKRPDELFGHTDIENGWDPELVKGNPAKGIRGFENDDRDALSGQSVHNPNDPANQGTETRIFDTRKLPLHDDENRIIGLLGIARDITESRRAGEAIQASLREKEALLREIHHRVKNNLQIISSLMSLQAEHLPDEGARKMLKESQTRIRSMAFIHEKLYQSRDLSKVDFTSYIRSLAASLFQSYKINPGQVQLEADLEDVSIDINSAGPCGLLVNELISNALKHAFPAERNGTVRIGLRREADAIITLRVADDGVGFPEGLDFRKADSFGLQILGLLVEQLDAKIELDTTSGTAFTISFRELEYKPRI